MEGLDLITMRRLAVHVQSGWTGTGGRSTGLLVIKALVTMAAVAAGLRMLGLG